MLYEVITQYPDLRLPTAAQQDQDVTELCDGVSALTVYIGEHRVGVCPENPDVAMDSGRRLDPDGAAHWADAVCNV